MKFKTFYVLVYGFGGCIYISTRGVDIYIQNDAKNLETVF